LLHEKINPKKITGSKSLGDAGVLQIFVSKLEGFPCIIGIALTAIRIESPSPRCAQMYGLFTYMKGEKWHKMAKGKWRLGK